MRDCGDNIGPYKLLSKLGKGTFGTVWLAERKTSVTTTKVAVKVANDYLEDYETFEKEANLWVLASGHPNVLPIIEADVFDGHLTIVSELASEGTLGDWLKLNHGDAPTIPTVVDILTGILKGLEFLHSRGIIHRDIKPANILMQGNIPRLADFGISRLFNPANDFDTAGTPNYMAPEAFNGMYNQQTDIWSVGVIFYQLLLGRLPFTGEHIQKTVKQILFDEPYIENGSVPHWLGEVLKKSLSKQPESRYSSATEMLSELDSILVRVELLSRPRVKTNDSVTFDLSDFKPDVAAYETPRNQHIWFAHMYLRELAKPGAPVNILLDELGKDTDGSRLRQKWIISFRINGGGSEMIKPDRLASFPIDIDGKYRGVIIQFPLPERISEALFAAIILPEDYPSLDDPNRIKSLSLINDVPRYFVLQLGEALDGMPTIDFCEWIDEFHQGHLSATRGQFDFSTFEEILKKYFRARRNLQGSYWPQPLSPVRKVREYSFYTDQEDLSTSQLEGVYSLVRRWCDINKTWYQLAPRTDGFDILLCHPTLASLGACNNLWMEISDEAIDLDVYLNWGPLRT